VSNIATLDNDRWYPIEQVEQSRYMWAPCDQCGGRIEPNETHLRRMWKNGPAEAKQHLVCPSR
jgi:hypothetical protein